MSNLGFPKQYPAVRCRVYTSCCACDSPSGQGCAGVGLLFIIRAAKMHLSLTAGGVAEQKHAPFERFTRRCPALDLFLAFVVYIYCTAVN